MKYQIVVMSLLLCMASAYAEMITRGSVDAQGSSAAVMTISNAGVYQLSGDYAGEIVISASNATLDLQGFTVNGATRGICITGSNVMVQNGIIRGATIGVRIEGDNNQCIGLDLVSNGTGMEIVGNGNTIADCSAYSNTSAGFSLVGASRNILSACVAIDNGGAGNVFGFVSQNGAANIFKECVAERTQTSGLNPLYAAGFVLTGTEQKSKILECQANNSTGALAYGIRTTGIQVQNSILMNNQSMGNVTGFQDDAAANSTNQWLGNLAANNTTNFNIGAQFPFSATKGTGDGRTDNLDASLTDGGPAEKIMATIVDQTAQASTRISQLLQYNPVFVTSATTLSTSNYYLLTRPLLASTITILNANGLTLDLNGQTVQNIVVTNSSRVNIVNGFVRASSYPTGTNTAAGFDAISVANSPNVNLYKLFVTGGAGGITIDANSRRAKFNSCFFNSNRFSGIFIPSGDDSFVDLCLACRNREFQGLTNHSNRVRVVRCMFNRNATRGFNVTSGGTTECRSNFAVGNGTFGFEVVATAVVSNNVFINNFGTANGSGTNFTPTAQYGAFTANILTDVYTRNSQTQF